MSKETNLTSLKVYGNDDPAGSVYKVSGGGSDKMALRIAVDGPDSNGAMVWYLTYLDGSSVTWEEIYNAMLRGITLVAVVSGGHDDSSKHVYHTRVLGAYIMDGLYCAVAENPDDVSNVIEFSASTADGRLESAISAPSSDEPHV